MQHHQAKVCRATKASKTPPGDSRFPLMNVPRRITPILPKESMLPSAMNIRRLCILMVQCNLEIDDPTTRTLARSDLPSVSSFSPYVSMRTDLSMLRRPPTQHCRRWDQQPTVTVNHGASVPSFYASVLPCFVTYFLLSFCFVLFCIVSFCIVSFCVSIYLSA